MTSSGGPGLEARLYCTRASAADRRMEGPGQVGSTATTAKPMPPRRKPQMETIAASPQCGFDAMSVFDSSGSSLGVTKTGLKSSTSLEEVSPTPAKSFFGSRWATIGEDAPSSDETVVLREKKSGYQLGGFLSRRRQSLDANTFSETKTPALERNTSLTSLVSMFAPPGHKDASRNLSNRDLNIVAPSNW